MSFISKHHLKASRGFSRKEKPRHHPYRTVIGSGKLSFFLHFFKISLYFS